MAANLTLPHPLHSCEKTATRSQVKLRSRWPQPTWPPSYGDVGQDLADGPNWPPIYDDIGRELSDGNASRPDPWWRLVHHRPAKGSALRG